MELKDKTALITGSTGKIGRRLAGALAGEGVHCLCHFYRHKRLADKVVQAVCRHGVHAWALEADFRKEDQIRRLFQKVQKHGPVDLLIHTAALFAKTPIKTSTPRQIRDLIQVNFTASALLAHHFVKSLPQSGRGNPSAKIIFFADIGAIRPWKNYSIYCAAKAAVIALTQSLAKELAPQVTVNAIALGIAEGSLDSPQEIAARKKRIPAAIFVPVEEVLEAVKFILKTDSITGRVLVLDGGAVL